MFNNYKAKSRHTIFPIERLEKFYEHDFVYSYDVETFEKINLNDNVTTTTPFSCSFSYGNKIHSFFGVDVCISDSLIYMMKIFPIGESQVYIHNLDFDYRFILKSIIEEEELRIIKYDVLMSSVDYVIRFTIQLFDKTIVFKDSAKIFKCSLWSAAKEIGMSKMPYPYQFINDLYLYTVINNLKEDFFSSWNDDMRIIYKDIALTGELHSFYISNLGFNSEEEKNRYLLNNNFNYTFNVAEYTSKYCSRDVEITSFFIPIYFKESVASIDELYEKSY